MIPIGLAISDFHFTLNTPVCRTELDILETETAKLRSLVNRANELDVPLICAGDMLDDKNCSHECANLLTDILRDLERPFLAVFGQHELHYHDPGRKFSSPLTSVLFATGKDLAKVPYTLRLTSPEDEDGIPIEYYGLSWNEDCDFKDTKRTRRSKKIRILVQHRMVWLGEPPFPTEEQRDVRDLIGQAPYKRFDVIVTGDNHQQFTYERDGRLWVNCGCVFRTSTLEKGIRPSGWELYLDGENMKAVQYKLPYKINHVTREHIEEKKDKEELDSQFIEHLETSSFSFDYVQAVKEIMDELESPLRVREKVDVAIHEGSMALSEKRKAKRVRIA